MNTNLKKVNKLKKSSRRNMKTQQPKFVERLIKISRVSKVTKGGKKLSFRAIVVIGNENGKVGVGVAKADDVVNAFKKDFGACKVIIKPSIEGSGVIAGGAIRIVLEVAGVKNVIAKQLGSNNLLNNARASICALNNLTTKSEVSKNRDLNFKMLF